MSNSTLQALVDSYEDIPAMMHRIRDGNSGKTTRFHPAVAPNQSVQAEQALRGHSKMESRTADFASMARMARQAKKVMNHISNLPASSASSSTPLGPSTRLKSRSVSDSAHITMQKLESLQNSGVDLSHFYSQYDVHKRGRVSYKDFADTMMHLCSGVNKQDLYSVAAAVDAQKTGSVSYDNLLSSLKAVRDTVKYQSLPSNPSSSHPNTKFASAFARVEVGPPPKAVIDVVPLSDALQPCLSAPYDYETGQSKSDRRRAAAVQESCFERIFHSTCPFHVDSQSPAVEHGRMKTERTAKRARSAPPRAERTSFYRGHFRHDRLPVASSSDLEPGQVPLRTLLTDMRERTYASRLGLVSESDADPTAVSSTTGPIKAAEHAAAMDKKNREAQGRVWNRVLKESKANIPVLKHLLRQHDLSNSGKVSTEEFRQALHKAGVALTNSEQQQLVMQLGARANTATSNKPITVPSSEGEGSGGGGTKSHRSLQSSSVHSVIASNAPRDGDGSVIDIDGFLEALSARASSASYQHVLSSSTNTQNQFSNNNPPQRKEQGMHSVTEREEGRVARKVLESWQRHSNPTILLQDALQQTSGASVGPILSEAPVAWSQVLQLLRNAQTGLSPRDIRILQRSLHLADSSSSLDTDPPTGSVAVATTGAENATEMTWGQLETNLKSVVVRASMQSQQATSVASYLANAPNAVGGGSTHTARKQQFRYSPTYASSISFHSAPCSPTTVRSASASSASSSSASVSQNRALGDLVDTSLFAGTTSSSSSSKVTKQQQQEFAKLQTRLAASSEQLVEAFLHPKYNQETAEGTRQSSQDNTGGHEGHTSRVPTRRGSTELKKTLRQRLHDVGVVLTTEDAQRLERHLQLQQPSPEQASSSTGPVSLESTQTGTAALEEFCSALKLPFRTRSDVFQNASHHAKVKYSREVVDPREVGARSDDVATPGVFASGTQHSLLATPTFATTGGLSPTRSDRLAHGLLPVFKRRSQSVGRFNSLADYLAATSAETRHGHTSQFWEMRASVDDTLLFPTPPNSSSSYPKHPTFVHAVHPGKARRGVVSLQEYKQNVPSHWYEVSPTMSNTNTQQHPTAPRPDSRLSVSSSVSGTSSTNNLSVASTVVPSHRPTAAGSHHHLRNYQSHRPTPEFHIVTGDHDSAAPGSSVSTPHYNATPYHSSKISKNSNNKSCQNVGSNTNTPTAVVSKWAKPSLSAFFEERERVFGGAMANCAKQDASEPGRSASRGRSRQARTLADLNNSDYGNGNSNSNSNHNSSTNTVLLTPEPAAHSGHKRSYSLPPYATYEGC